MIMELLFSEVICVVLLAGCSVGSKLKSVQSRKCCQSTEDSACNVNFPNLKFCRCDTRGVRGGEYVILWNAKHVSKTFVCVRARHTL